VRTSVLTRGAPRSCRGRGYHIDLGRPAAYRDGPVAIHACCSPAMGSCQPSFVKVDSRKPVSNLGDLRIVGTDHLSRERSPWSNMFWSQLMSGCCVRNQCSVPLGYELLTSTSCPALTRRRNGGDQDDLRGSSLVTVDSRKRLRMDLPSSWVARYPSLRSAISATSGS
jgi:hypothetical protein